MHSVNLSFGSAGQQHKIYSKYQCIYVTYTRKNQDLIATKGVSDSTADCTDKEQRLRRLAIDKYALTTNLGTSLIHSYSQLKHGTKTHFIKSKGISL